VHFIQICRLLVARKLKSRALAWTDQPWHQSYQCKTACSHQLACFCARSLPLSLRLDVRHPTGRLSILEYCP
jgi:hypothetical protein